MVVKYFWIFSGSMLDYTLAPITYLEETSGPSVRIQVNDFVFTVPASWHVLITDDETYQLDTVPISNCAVTSSLALVMSPEDMKFRTAEIKVLDYLPHETLIHPMIQKGCALQHPVGLVSHRDKMIQASITIGPYDLYKFVADKAIGDVLS